MTTDPRTWTRTGLCALALWMQGGLGNARAAAPPAAGPPPARLLIPPELQGEPGAPAPSPLTVEQLLSLAAQNHPDVAAARARAEAARGRLIQAGLYPNPVVNVHDDEINNPGGPVGHIGVTFSQQIVRGGKL